MDLSPEVYGACWRGGVRMAAGVFIAIVIFRAIQPFLTHPQWLPQVFGWVIVALVFAIGGFLVAIGIAHVVRASSTEPQRRH